MKYYNIYNGYGKMAVKAYDDKNALKKYCSSHGMLSVPDKWYAIEITKEEYEKAYYKIV